MTNGSKLFFPPWRNSPWCARVSSLSRIYRGVQLSPYPDPGWKHVTATNTYNTITRLTAYSTNSVNMFLLFVRRKYWYSVVSLDRCSLFPSRVGIRTDQHPCVRSHLETRHSVRFLWTSDRPDAEAPTRQHTTLRTDMHAPAGFDPAIPATVRHQTQALDRAAPGSAAVHCYGLFKQYK